MDVREPTNHPGPVLANSKNLRSKTRDRLAWAFVFCLFVLAILVIRPAPVIYSPAIERLKTAYLSVCQTRRVCAFFFDLSVQTLLPGLLEGCRLTRVLHEGAHLVAAHWYLKRSERIRAKGIHVYVDYTPKDIWLRITLFPLVLPLSFFCGLAVLNLHFAAFVSTLMLVWSSKDFANIVMVFRSPGNLVRDIEEGLFVLQT